MLRFIKSATVCYVALFFTLVALNNIIDYNSDYQFVVHVLKMDTTFQSPNLIWRSLHSAWYHNAAYIFIICIEALSAVILWIAGINLFRHIRSPQYFIKYKKLASLGLFIGFSLYFVGFITIGGEWFVMWQSSVWNGQAAAGLFGSMIMFILLFINQTDDVQDAIKTP